MASKTVRLNTGAQMPLLGLGTWEMTGRVCEQAVISALNAGYRHIDTASIYGNEKEVGKAVKESGVPRKELFITTKIWNSDHGDVENALESSLKRLGTDYVDLYLIHWPVRERLDTWRSFEGFVEDGRCKAVGVSNFTIRHLEELLKTAKTPPAVNQVEFSPFLYQRELLDFCRSKGILLEAYSPLARGRKMKNKKLVDIAGRYRISVAQLMLRWAVQRGLVVIPKSKTPERIKENMGIFGFEIKGEDMKTLDSMNEDFRTCWDPNEID